MIKNKILDISTITKENENSVFKNLNVGKS